MLEILYTSGSGETQQAVISGAVDVGTAVGTMGAMSAFAKGAPIRIIGAETTGGADYWYVAATSPIKTMKDTDGKTIAYSTNGASTPGVVLAFIKELNLKARPVATGSPPSTLTQVMTGQVDVVGVAAVRHQGDRREQDPRACIRNRSAGGARAEHPGTRRQCGGAGEAPRRARALRRRLSRDARQDV